MPRESTIRLTVVLTHPVQYYAPWFRHITASVPQLALTVLYATEPTPEQQGTDFNTAFRWDIPLRDRYCNEVLRPATPKTNVNDTSFFGVNVPEIAGAIERTRPDVVLLPGWHSVTYWHALQHCRRKGIPVLYRGDTNMNNAPAGWKRIAWYAKTRFLLRRFTRYLAVGKRSAEYLRFFGAREDDTDFVPHCVDNEFFASRAAPFQEPQARSATRRALGLNEDDFVLLFAGKLISHKRPLDLIEAASRLGAGAAVLIAGTGPLRETLEEHARRKNVRLVVKGFVNQSDMGSMYAIADCLVLPSGGARESWGLVVNEAQSTGLPCVVSEAVGCAPDLVTPGVTGEIFAVGDIEELADALNRVRQGQAAGVDYATACRARVDQYSYRVASQLLADACAKVLREPAVQAAPQTRVLACCGNMVVVGGLERMTFEVLRIFRSRGASVHCVVNEWENHRIVPLMDRIGASWTTGSYRANLTRRTFSPVAWTKIAWDVAKTSVAMLRDALGFRPTHILAPDFVAVLRNWPILLLLRLFGTRVVLRVGIVPNAGRLHGFVWRRLLPPVVDAFVPNSQFTNQEILKRGVPAARVHLVQNALSQRHLADGADSDVVTLIKAKRTVLCVGQLAAFKGTHLCVEAVLRLISQGYDIQSVIVGRVPIWPPEYVEYVERLREEIRRAGADDRIQMVGERQNVLEIMRNSYVLVAPILGPESFGNVVLEACSVGLPVVAFAQGGVTELIQDGITGVLCRDATADGLVNGLRSLLDDPSLRDRASLASSEYFRTASEYHPEQFADRWWGLLQKDGV